MDIQSNSREITTPLSYKSISFYKAEDSGYHTSFATPSLECSSTPNENQDSALLVTSICKIKVDCYPITPGSEVQSLHNQYNSFNSTNTNSSFEGTPLARRGVKRRYEEGGTCPNEAIYETVATPTSLIANEVQKLKVNDGKVINATSFDSGLVDTFVSDIYSRDYLETSTHPSTPIKKVCKTNCSLSPFNRKRSPRKVDFAIHSLSCEKQIVKVQGKPPPSDLATNRFGYKPNQKLDIIKMLYSHEDYCSTSIKNILRYLSREDIYNFTLVSQQWCNIFKNVNTKQTYRNFFTSVKSNLENWDKIETPKLTSDSQIKPLKDIQNVNFLPSTTHSPTRSPTRSPRTTRFNKFTKAASLDTRSQMFCIKCWHPAKVTIETSGEEWGECTSSTCAQQFCSLCKYKRHPGKVCLKYDLDGPSPSKRKKSTCTVSSSKSKQKLKRLLF